MLFHHKKAFLIVIFYKNRKFNKKQQNIVLVFICANSQIKTITIVKITFKITKRKKHFSTLVYIIYIIGSNKKTSLLKKAGCLARINIYTIMATSTL